MQYTEFFQKATGLERPYPYQTRLAESPWPDFLDVVMETGKAMF